MIETYLILLDGDEADEALFLAIFGESAASAGSRPLGPAPGAPRDAPPVTPHIPADLTLRQGLARDKTARIRAAVEQCGGDRNEAARRLGVSPVTLWRALRGEA
jgi:DNA-binding NtrC family response regulator